jgi:DnaK suppressor protein
MRSTDLKRFKKQLLEKRDDLLDRVRAARSRETNRVADEAPDMGDRALSTVSRDLLYHLSGSEREILRRIDAALERVDSGDYGVCVHCAKKVQLARLKAVPWARHCIECQELQDQGVI